MPPKAPKAPIASKKRTLQPEQIEKHVREFVTTGNLAKAMEKIGCSKASVYVYANKLENGLSLIDKRVYGNNRRYGKKLA